MQTEEGKELRRARDRRRTAYKQAKRARRALARTLGDLTTADVRQLLASRVHCPLCRAKMSDAPGRRRSKHLDHIVPLALGGAHTRDNVRVICARCNLSRPYDGSDLVGVQTSLYAVLAPAAPAPNGHA